jgi:hypothetical protein
MVDGHAGAGFVLDDSGTFSHTCKASINDVKRTQEKTWRCSYWPKCVLGGVAN